MLCSSLGEKQSKAYRGWKRLRPIEYINVVIWKAQVEYDRKFSHHEETKITKQRQNILSFSLRVLRALRGEKCLA